MSKAPTFWLGGVEVGPDGRPANAPAPTTQDGADVQDLLTANADLKADLDKVTAERDALKAGAGAVTLPDDLEGKIAALKSVTKASAAEVMGVIREALGVPAPTEPE